MTETLVFILVTITTLIAAASIFRDVQQTHKLERAIALINESEAAAIKLNRENETLRKEIGMLTGGGPFRAAVAVPDVADREALHAREIEMERVGWQPQLVGAHSPLAAGERLIDVCKKIVAQTAERERREDAERRKKS